MKNKLSKAALSASGLILLSTFASGQTVYIEKDTGDSINEGYYDTLGGSGEGSEWEVREEDGTEYLWAKGFHFNRLYADDWVGLADYEIQPTDEEPLIFSYRMYDALDAEEGDDRLTDAYTEVSDLPKVILFAFGAWGRNDVYAYRNYPYENWVYFDDLPREQGWHDVKWVIRKGDFDLYFDGEPIVVAQTHHGSSANINITRVSLNGYTSTSREGFGYSDVYLALDPAYASDIEITKQPNAGYRRIGAVSKFGETFTVNVEAEIPGQPDAAFDYQWFRDGEPLVDSDRISGALTDTLTITGTDGSDSGKYRVDISPEEGGAVRHSQSLELTALQEHEIIMTVSELDPEDFTGTWQPLGPGLSTGWDDNWHTANLTSDPNNESIATFRPEITKSGTYEIWSFFSPSYSGPDDNRTTEGAYIVTSADGVNVDFINQQNPGGPGDQEWVYVGTHNFEEGTSGSVGISSLRQGPNGDDIWGNIILADTVRWIPVADEDGNGEGVSLAIALAEDDIQVMITGEPDTEYRIESTDDLSGEWSEFGSFTTDSEGSASFTDDAIDEVSKRFYRIAQ